MLTDPKLRSQVDALWDKFWTGGLANPLDAIEQLTRSDRDDELTVVARVFERRQRPRVVRSTLEHAHGGIVTTVLALEAGPLREATR